ncbi:MAG: hypothetical protein ACKV2Q_28625 [Planctomycetaceae bacterium]
MKSPAWALATEPLVAIQSAAFAEFRQAKLPIAKRYLVKDVTVEALAHCWNNNREV